MQDSINFEYERDEVKYRATMSPQVETRADGKTDIVGVIVILVDVSSLRQAEEALESVRADHARSLIDEAAAKEASQMKTEFVSTVNRATLFRWK
jgi:D-mannonate dehydratase